MDGLSTAEARAVFRARRALAASLEAEGLGPEAVMPLVISATLAGFLDILAASSGTGDEILGFINDRLAPAGLQVVALGD